MLLVAAAILERNGTILIARRKPGGRFGGAWEFPGGKVEPGEQPDVSLRRELREELGLDVRVDTLVGRFPFRSSGFELDLLAFRAKVILGTVRLSDHDEVRWVRPFELATYAFAEPDLPVVRLLMGEGPG